MNIIIYLLAIFGLTFLLSQSDGPFGVIGKIRNTLMKNKYVGVFFFELLSCPFCLGCWSGWLVYLVVERQWFVGQWLLTGLAGGAWCLLVSAWLNKTNQ